MVYHFDYTGMYAQIMKEGFSYGKYEIIENPESISNNGFYYVKTYIEESIPCLPRHSSSHSKLLFVNGYTEGLYWWEEIELLLENGGLIIEIKY